jgi:uncharacterized protein (PEP-CTERM system associated)
MATRVTATAARRNVADSISQRTARFAARSIVLLPLVAVPQVVHAQLMMPTEPFGRVGGQLGSANMLGTGSTGLRAPLAFNYGVNSRLTWTDNGSLAPPGQEDSDVIFEIAPYVQVSAAGPQAQGSLTYTPRIIMRNLDVAGANDLRHQLDAFGNLFLVDENIGIQARANVWDVSANPFGRTSFDPSLNPANVATYQRYDVSPYARGRLGTGTQFEARYRFTYTDDGAINDTITDHTLSGLLANLRTSYPLGWRAFGEARQSTYSSGFDYNRAFATALGHYNVNSALRLGLGVNYSSSDLLLSESGKDSGWGPSATLEWTPSQRSSLSLAWAGTYFGSSARAIAAHRAQNWVFGASYTDRVEDRINASLVAVNPNQTFSADGTVPSANPITQQLNTQGTLPQSQAPLSFGGINSALVNVQTLTGSVGYLMLKTSYALTGFITRQDNNLNLATNLPGGSTPQDLEQRGLNFRATHRLGERIVLGGILRYQESESVNLAETSTLRGFQVDASYQWTTTIFTGLGYRHTRQRGEGSSVLGYDENAVFATLSARF